MTIRLFWWSPSRSPRTMASELVNHGRAWAYLVKNGRRSISNFGDQFAPIALTELTGRRSRWAGPRSADVYSTGSLLNLYARRRARALIFGSGVRSPAGLDLDAIDTKNVIAVRGAKTRDLLGLPPSTPLGDPGLTVGVLDLGVARRTSVPLFLPHFAVAASSEGRREISGAVANGFRVVLPNEDPLTIARVIRDAPFVATTSLHGLVFAHALGTPATLVSLSSQRHEEPSFKYEDYATAVGADIEAVPLETVGTPAKALAFAESRQMQAQTLLQNARSVVERLQQAARSL